MTIIDIIVYVWSLLFILIIVLVKSELAQFGISALTGVTTVYVSLRLGYTAKAGLENYKKIAENYKAITECDLDTTTEESSCDQEDENG